MRDEGCDVTDEGCRWWGLWWGTRTCDANTSHCDDVGEL